LRFLAWKPLINSGFYREVGQSVGGREPIDSYLHTFYEDTEALSRENVYRLGI